MENLHFNFFQLIILFSSVQGIFFSCFVFFIKSNQSKGSFYLGLTVLFLSISNIQHMLIDVNYFTVTSVIRRLYIPWQWLVAPLFYLFAHYFLQKKRIPKRVLALLILPFVLVTNLHFGQFIYQTYFVTDFVITNYYEKGLFLYTNTLSFIYIPLIGYKTYMMIDSYEKTHGHNILKIQEEVSWLKKIIHVGIGISSVGMVSVIFIFILNMEKLIAYPFFISLSIWIYWVGYTALQKVNSSEILKKLSLIKTPKKTGNTTFIKINAYILNEKKYLSSNINLNNIAQEFGISSGYLSQLINTHTQSNFNDYINELRITASKKMLSDPQFKNYTIEAIGLECGFKSKSNFFATFKKFSTETPNQYKNAKNKSRILN